jgi:uncharacterized protein YifE (UPF0438 family)
MMGDKLVLHCGGARVNRHDVEMVPVPGRTATWNPLPYADSIGVVRDVLPSLTGREIVAEEYGLNRDGRQMFALFRMSSLAGDPSSMGMAIGLRGSYDKSLANGLVCGSNVFVCDNLAFSGSDFKIMRRNTSFVTRVWREMVINHLARAQECYRSIAERAGQLEGLACPERRGFAMLGVALGEKVLNTEQATVAFNVWRRPEHEEHAARNVWSLYNAMTEGLKRGVAGTVLERHTRAHDFIDAVVVPKCGGALPLVSVAEPVAAAAS